jgi:hypothetical protein
MRTDGLQLQYLPPLRIPFRFFISAPLFGVLGALLLLSASTDGWASRWLPEVMAATHLLTLGFMATVMLGALFQVLPVLSGHNIPGQRWLAPAVHFLVSGGALALGGAFIWPDYGWQFTAVIMLGTGFTLFIGALGLRLIRPGGGDSIFAIRLAALSLLIALGLGIIILSAYMGVRIPLHLANPGAAHLRFALLGWVLLLIMGVSYQVIPMFHVTPDYPGYIRKMLPTSVFVALGVLTFGHTAWLTLVAGSVLVVAAGGYVLITLYLFTQRKRKVSDYTIRFWQLGLSCLLLALLGYTSSLVNIVRPNAATELQWGILMIPGFAISIMIGMLYKIAPFLSWLHLQQCSLKSPVNSPVDILQLPTMQDLLPVKRARIQFRLHCLSLILLLGAVQLPAISPLAAIALAADFVWLEISLLTVLRAYRNALTANC